MQWVEEQFKNDASSMYTNYQDQSVVLLTDLVASLMVIGGR